MSFLVFFVCGIAGGVLGGMGMGGGTVLIPLLTLVCGVGQVCAQGVNLLSFLPMSLFALSVHAKNGLLGREGLLLLIPPALAFSVLLSFAAHALPAAALRRAFGLFLVVLSMFRFSAALSSKKSARKP